jgi:hypothetical protein
MTDANRKTLARTGARCGKPSATRPGSVARLTPRSDVLRASAPAGWPAAPPPAEAGRIVAAIKAAAGEAGRSIDEDHYGAGFAFHFGSPDAPVVGRAMDAYAKRTGRVATHVFVVGDADAILARVAEYVDASVSKFLLRPLGGDDDAILTQTRLLIEQVLPRRGAVAETSENHHDQQIAKRNPSRATCSASDATRERDDAHWRGHVFHRLLDAADRTCASTGGPRR